jgi:2C-methyl-D-erythritol 2,4-cyclodiphosphate synthase
MDGEPFDHDVRRYIRLFKEKDYYKVNAVTTLMAEYQARQPKLSHMQVKKAVANYLSIPDSIDLDEIIYSSEWFCYRFSHYLFMKEVLL